MEKETDIEIRFRGVPILTVLYIIAILVMYLDFVFWRR